ncbi:MAG: hypothetical protein IJU51_07130 [Clostridia bacterium]|nr:hypothetical protein [Clostridia bacterium]
MRLFREDLTFLRRDIKIGTLTLDDRLQNVDIRLTKNLEKLLKIRETFYVTNSLPMDEPSVAAGNVPYIYYPDVINPPVNDNKNDDDDL